MSGGNGPLDSMRSLEQFLPGEQPRGFMGPDGGPKGNIFFYYIVGQKILKNPDIKN